MVLKSGKWEARVLGGFSVGHYSHSGGKQDLDGGRRRGEVRSTTDSHKAE